MRTSTREPLSPLLLILVAIWLNRMLGRAQEATLTTGLPRFGSMAFVNLQYAYDTLIFENYDIK